MRAIDNILFRWACVLAVSATVLLSGKTLVLCVSDHGHAAVEWAHQDTDCDHESSSESGTFHSYMTDHCHSTCTDMALPPVIAGRLTQEVEQACVDMGADHVLFKITWVPLLRAVVPALCICPDTRLDKQVTHSLSSTVLLI